MMRIDKLITIAALLPLLAGCSVKDPIHETAHPEKGKITVTTDWSALEGGVAAKPTEWTVAVGGRTWETGSDTYTIPEPFTPGAYSLALYNAVAGIMVNEGIAAVETVTAPQGQTGTYITPLPGWLVAGTEQVTVQPDSRHDVTVAMRRQVRQLTIVITPDGGTSDRISGIEAVLTGVAGAWDIAADSPAGDASAVALDFAPITEGDDAGKWSATVRLLGVTGAAQTLTGTVKFTDGEPSEITLQSDMTGGLAGFNEEKEKPLTLGGTLNTPTGGDFTGFTITGWEVVQGQPQEAN